MIVLFHLGHPAHFHLFKNAINKLHHNGHKTIIVIKNKDVLVDLLKSEGFKFINIHPHERKNSFFSLVLSVFEKARRLMGIIKEYKPDLMIGTSAEIGFIGRLKGVPSIIVNEDDWSQIPLFAFISYPFGTAILAPECCNVGFWNYKKIPYPGYHELAYLSPKYFQPDQSRIKKLFGDKSRYFIIRLAKLSAHHDIGKAGVNDKIAEKLIKLLKSQGNVYLTSERELSPELEPYRISVSPEHIHDALFFSDLYIGDSQTMAAEAAVLGTPSIRFSDFVGKLGYLDELEHKYHLTYGIPTNRTDELYSKTKELINKEKIKTIWKQRRKKMLSEQIDVTEFFTWLFKEFPSSYHKLKKNPEIINEFKS